MFDAFDIFDYLSWQDSYLDSKIIDYVESRKNFVTTKEDIDNFLNDNNINYSELSSFAKNKLNELDI